MDIVEKIRTCHAALRRAEIPHAFGGALALAWCTQSARGTIDIDLNVLTDQGQIEAVMAALPAGVEWAEEDVARLRRDHQHRLWWLGTPLDIFFNSTDFHEELIGRIRWESFAGEQLPFLSCRDLAVFKVFFDRGKDWVDLEAMRDAGTLDYRFVSGVISDYLGPDDPRLKRLFDLKVR